MFSNDPNLSHPNYFFSKLDIKQENDVFEILDSFVPDKVINMAAESHVDKSISCPEIFLKTNVLGTYNLLQASLKF